MSGRLAGSGRRGMPIRMQSKSVPSFARPRKHWGVTLRLAKNLPNFSYIRNAPEVESFEGTYGEWVNLPLQPDHCHCCRLPFALGQVRYTVMDACSHRWGIASICSECFEDYTDCSTHPHLERHYSTCEGCGEPIFTPVGPRWSICSFRCYQRQYRKRRRGRNSVVDWKAHRPNPTCTVCRRPLDQWGKQHKRRDAAYCSPKCRQWAYRRRKGSP